MYVASIIWNKVYGKMTRLKKIAFQAFMLIQLHLAHCQWFYPGQYDPYTPYGCDAFAQPRVAYNNLPYRQPELYDPQPPCNQPPIIIINDDDDGGSDNDRFRFEEILTLLLSSRFNNNNNNFPPPPPQNFGCCNCGCCCCNNNNNCNNCNNNNNCNSCNNDNNNCNNCNNNNCNGNGGSTLHVTIVLPNNCKND